MVTMGDDGKMKALRLRYVLFIAPLFLIAFAIHYSSSPSSTKVLVFGANGWIGGQIHRKLLQQGFVSIKATTRPGSDPDAKVKEELMTVKPTHVISVLGRTHGPGSPTIDYLEGGPDKLLINLRDNLYAPVLLARLCEGLGIHFSYFGTGCIFKYDDVHQPHGLPMKEDDVPNFFGSSYSVAKGFTDRLMHQFEGNTLNIRIRMPFNDEDHPRNFITKLVRYSKVINTPNSVTYLPDALDVLVDSLQKKRTGTLNLVNPGLIDHKEVLDMYREIVNSSHRVTIVTPEEQRKHLAADRSNTYLDTERLVKWAPQVLPVKDAMRQAMERIRKAKDQHLKDHPVG